MTDFEFFPHSVVWEITFACNMRCLHCGTAAGRKRPNELSTEEALNLIDELAALKAQAITLSGGEPLLREDWRQLAERIVGHGMKVLLISNGYIMSKDDIKEFERLKFNDVGISLDGTEKTHDYIRQRPGSWKNAVGALRMIAENGNFGFCAVSSISNINIDDVDQIHETLIDAGCKLWRLQIVTGTGRMEERKDLCLSLENYERLIKKMLQYKEEGRILIDVGENIGYYGNQGYALWDTMPYFGCYAGLRIVGIESDGTIKGCLSQPEEFVEGNIRDSSFTEIWNNPDGFAYNRKFTRETAKGFCHDCKYLPLCRGGCTTTSMSASGCRANNPYCIYKIECEKGIKQGEDTDLVKRLLSQFEPVGV